MHSFKHSQRSTRQRSLLLTWTALLTLALCSCAVPIKEENFYTDRGPDGAVITHFFSTESQDISRAAWDSIREGMTCMSPEAIGDIKGEIEKLCSKVNCNEQTLDALDNQSVSPKDLQAFRQAVFRLDQFLVRLDGNTKR